MGYSLTGLVGFVAVLFQLFLDSAFFFVLGKYRHGRYFLY